MPIDTLRIRLEASNLFLSNIFLKFDKIAPNAAGIDGTNELSLWRDSSAIVKLQVSYKQDTMAANQADEEAKEIQTKYDEFQKVCKTILPKVDLKLIQEFLFRQQEGESDGEPRYTVEVHTKEGLDTQKIKELIWSELGEMPDIDYHGTQYKFDHRLT